MSYDEDAFMRLDSASEESEDHGQESEENKYGSINCENIIMEYLLNGFAMTSKECKTCNTPLVKNVQPIEEEKGWFGKKKLEQGKPVNNVPFCVSCKCIVVTSNEELQVMWQNDNKHLMSIDGAMSLDIEVISKEDLLAVARAQERNFEDEDDEEEEQQQRPARKKVVPIMRESSSGLLIVSKDKSEDEPAAVAVHKENRVGQTNREDTIDDVEVKLDESPPKEKVDFDIIDYKKRRQIATKVLGAKMIQGYSLKESQCTECTMPLMERPDTQELLCVVCPVLEKKVKKKMEERAMAKKNKERNVTKDLQRQLDEEQLYLEEVKVTREAAANLDYEIQRARKERIEEEELLLAEEKERQRRVGDEERNLLIEELRRAKTEREAEKNRHEVESAAAEEWTTQENLREIHRQEERHRMIEEVREAKEQKELGSRLRIAEAQEATERQRDTERRHALKDKEHQKVMEDTERRLALKDKEHQKVMEDTERRLALKDKEHQKVMEDFKQAQLTIKQSAAKRVDELAAADLMTKIAEEQLVEWRESTDKENAAAESMRHDAEEKLLDAEEALIEAEELALQAQNAKDMGYGDRSRLAEMYRNAKQLRFNAELDDGEAREQLEEANRRLDNVARKRRAMEKRLAGAFEDARGNLEETKHRSLNEARQNQRRLKDAENEMLTARFGSHDDVGAAGDDWEARRLLGKKVLARQVMAGWTVMPEYCTGRMCNFTPLISKGSAVKCVVCEGSGDGIDGMYDEGSSSAVLDDTMSFVSKRNRFSRITAAPRTKVDQGDHKRGLANREVGRRMMKGWQLLESPCELCQMPLMSEAFGTPEICIFCDPDDNISYGDDDDDDENISVSSRQSITLEIPEGFDPSDSNAMAALLAKATSSIKGGRGREVPTRNRIPASIGGGQRPVSRSRGRIGGQLPRGPGMRSQSPGPRLTPESRNAVPSMRSGRNRGRAHRSPAAQPVLITTERFNDDNDDASQLSDDMSVAMSVASHTLDAILSKIDSCKAQLNAPDNGDDAASIVEKSEAADLMHKLTAAAAAVKQLEASAE